MKNFLTALLHTFLRMLHLQLHWWLELLARRKCCQVVASCHRAFRPLTTKPLLPAGHCPSFPGFHLSSSLLLHFAASPSLHAAIFPPPLLGFPGLWAFSTMIAWGTTLHREQPSLPFWLNRSWYFVDFLSKASLHLSFYRTISLIRIFYLFWPDAPGMRKDKIPPQVHPHDPCWIN